MVLEIHNLGRITLTSDSCGRLLESVGGVGDLLVVAGFLPAEAVLGGVELVLDKGDLIGETLDLLRSSDKSALPGAEVKEMGEPTECGERKETRDSLVRDLSLCGLEKSHLRRKLVGQADTFALKPLDILR